MPDYTDPFLFPFPTEEEYGDGSNGLEELARAVDAEQVRQNARLATLATKPTHVRNRIAVQAYVSGDLTLDFNNLHHDNFGPSISAVDGWRTPAVGAHPVAGVYPAIWRLDAFVHHIATVATLGNSRTFEVEQWELNLAIARDDISRTYRTYVVENATGGEYMQLSVCVALRQPARFKPIFFGDAGNIQAGSWMSITRIRSI